MKPFLWTLTISCLVLLAGLALFDQFVWGLTAQDVAQHYGAFDLDPNPAHLTVILTVTALIGAGLWALAKRMTAQTSTRWGWVGGLALLGSLCVAALGTFSHEYGAPVLPALWRMLLWLPVVLGAVTLWQQSAGKGR